MATSDVSSEASGAIWHPSPNFGQRRGDAKPTLIVLHYTAMESAEAALERLCSPEYEVSAHYLIARDGRLWQLVAEADRAWHAGAGGWGDVDDVNSASIGIELDNDGKVPFAEPMMTQLDALLRDVMARRAIPAPGVIGHSDCAPGRKADPGPRFDWGRLARRGLAASAEPVDDPGGDLDPLLRRAGYVAGTVEERLSAFRLRHRPGASGAAGPTDRATLAALPSARAIDRTPDRA